MGVTRTPRRDTESILAHTLTVPRESLIAHPERTLTDLESHTFDKLIALRARGMPIAYIIGQRAFFDRSFRVTSHVLIPRPETEILVAEAIAWARPQTAPRLIDVGTGSGVIGLTLAAHIPHAHVIAADVSAAALRIAQENAANLTNVQLVQADLLAPFGGARFDLIAANLPYIATGELDVLDVARFEPHVALDGGGDGLHLIRRLLSDAPRLLANSGLILLEHGADQGEAVAALARNAFPAARVEIIKDDAQLDRVVRIAQPPA
jgi:release factor glutamine methyltransferase